MASTIDGLHSHRNFPGGISLTAWMSLLLNLLKIGVNLIFIFSACTGQDCCRQSPSFNSLYQHQNFPQVESVSGCSKPSRDTLWLDYTAQGSSRRFPDCCNFLQHGQVLYRKSVSWCILVTLLCLVVLCKITQSLSGLISVLSFFWCSFPSLYLVRLR